MTGGAEPDAARGGVESDAPPSVPPGLAAGFPPGGTVAPGLVEHFFRREYGRLVAVFARRVGVQHIELVEDATQGAFLAALTAWTARGLPDDPGA